MYYKDTAIFACYMDDGIFLEPNMAEIDKAIQDLRDSKFNIEDCGSI